MPLGTKCFIVKQPGKFQSQISNLDFWIKHVIFQIAKSSLKIRCWSRQSIIINSILIRIMTIVMELYASACNTIYRHSHKRIAFHFRFSYQVPLNWTAMMFYFILQLWFQMLHELQARVFYILNPFPLKLLPKDHMCPRTFSNIGAKYRI